MSGDFIDSNVFISLVDPTDPTQQQTARELIRRAAEHGTGSISFQVVQETQNVMTRKLKTPLTSEDARSFLEEVLTPFWRVMPTPALYEHTLEIQARYQFSFYDSLVIAAALAAGCTRLYSEDLQHGQRIQGLRIENPFRA